jgi:hypothetical protein
MSQKIAINTENIPLARGYFAFSEEAHDYLDLHSDREEIEQFKRDLIKNAKQVGWYDNWTYTQYVEMFYKKNRSHPLLIQMIEELGSGEVSKATAACWIEIKEIPDNIEYKIVRDEDAGYETIIFI